MAAKKTLQSEANEIFTPKEEVENKSRDTNFYPKDSLFDKIKLFIDKKKPFEQQKLKADWKKISLKGKKIILKKGIPIKESEILSFSNEAKLFFLEERKSN